LPPPSPPRTSLFMSCSTFAQIGRDTSIVALCALKVQPRRRRGRRLRSVHVIPQPASRVGCHRASDSGRARFCFSGRSQMSPTTIVGRPSAWHVLDDSRRQATWPRLQSVLGSTIPPLITIALRLRRDLIRGRSSRPFAPRSSLLESGSFRTAAG